MKCVDTPRVYTGYIFPETNRVHACANMNTWKDSSSKYLFVARLGDADTKVCEMRIYQSRINMVNCVKCIVDYDWYGGRMCVNTKL